MTISTLRSAAVPNRMVPRRRIGWLVCLEQRLDASADTASLQAAAAEQAARERFEHHFGAVDLGHATGVDNEQIDVDLIKA